MVTTIKITCDGVFIQSNSFLTNAHHPRNINSNSIDSEAVNQLERSLRQSRSPHQYHRQLSPSSTPTNGASTLHNNVLLKKTSSESVVYERGTCINSSDKQFTISFLNSRQPKLLSNGVKLHQHTGDINNNNSSINKSTKCSEVIEPINSKSLVINNCDNLHKINNHKNNYNYKINSRNIDSKSVNKRQLGLSLSASSPFGTKKSSSLQNKSLTLAPISNGKSSYSSATKVKNIGQ